MDWGNAIVRSIRKSPTGVVETVEMDLHLEGDFKKTEKKITWLACSSDSPSLLNAELVDFDYLLTKKKIEEGEDWQNFVTPTTEFRKAALIDSNCGVLEKGAVIQFERKGYYILDSIEEAGFVFFLVPDGKVATVASKADKSTTTLPAIGQQPKANTANTGTVVPVSGASPMYSVKPLASSEPIQVEGVKMYSVKPVY